MHAPGRTLLFDALPVAHHLLLAHGRAAIALRAAGRRSSVGCANNHAPMWPASDDEADVGASQALRRALERDVHRADAARAATRTTSRRCVEDVIQDGDMATIRQPLDFYGVNYYNPMRIAAADEDVRDAVRVPSRSLGYPTTDFGWPVVPDALREWLIMLRARYRAALPPIIITESGLLLRHGARRGRRRRRPGPHRLPRRPPPRRRRRRSAPGSTSAATTRGR